MPLDRNRIDFCVKTSAQPVLAACHAVCAVMQDSNLIDVESDLDD
jgi:hypothetical protein